MATLKAKTGKADEAKVKMLELLESGEYKSGDRLPPESELVKILGCCRGTVREAIALLVSEGYLSRVRGSGTFVAPSKQRYYTIAAIFPDLCIEPDDTSVVAPIVSSVVAEARRNYADVILYGSGNDDVNLERYNIKRALDKQIDAVIIWYIGEEQNLDALEELYEANVPVVFVDRYAEKFNPDYAVTDNFAGTFDAVNAIAQLGIENIYYIANIEQCTSIKDRIQGYTVAVNSLGLPCNVVYSHIRTMIKGVYSGLMIDKDSNEYMSLKKTIEYIRFPAALFSDNPVVNSVVHEVLEDMNIPDNQIILGHFDSDPPSRLTDKCYFEVDQPFAEIGSRAVQIAMAKISGNNEPQQIALKPNLTIHNLSSFTEMKSGVSIVTSDN